MAWEMRAFYRDQLEIDDVRGPGVEECPCHVSCLCCSRVGVVEWDLLDQTELATMEWQFVLHKLVESQSKRELCIVKTLDALDITNRIMRKENYMIAFVNMVCCNGALIMVSRICV